MNLKAQIEAILFLTDKPIKAAAVARIVNLDVHVVRQALIELIHDYEERDGGLEIADDSDGYAIQVKDDYASITDEFAPMDMPVALIRTLSAIAIKQPVAQSDIIKIRGAGAYDHIKELIIRELIQKKEEGGRSPSLSTTKKFQEYFRLSQNAKSLRQDLVQQKRDALSEAEGEKQSDVTIGDALEILAAQSQLDMIELAARPLAATPLAETQMLDGQKPEIESAESVKAEAIEATHEELMFVEEPPLDSKDQLEKIYATSPDASLVYRPAEKEARPFSTEDAAAQTSEEQASD
jgi:segregation and condensation protein B